MCCEALFVGFHCPLLYLMINMDLDHHAHYKRHVLFHFFISYILSQPSVCISSKGSFPVWSGGSLIHSSSFRWWKLVLHRVSCILGVGTETFFEGFATVRGYWHILGHFSISRAQSGGILGAFIAGGLSALGTFGMCYLHKGVHMWPFQALGWCLFEAVSNAPGEQTIITI